MAILTKKDYVINLHTNSSFRSGCNNYNMSLLLIRIGLQTNANSYIAAVMWMLNIYLYECDSTSVSVHQNHINF